VQENISLVEHSYNSPTTPFFKHGVYV